jgi:hypothetical protein
MGLEKLKLYKCNNCGTLHEDEDDAYECCSDIEEVDGFKCGECGELYEDKEEAKECCE